MPLNVAVSIHQVLIDAENTQFLVLYQFIHAEIYFIYLWKFWTFIQKYIFCGFIASIPCVGIHEKFTTAITKAVKALRVGHGFEEGVNQVVICSSFFSSP